MHQHYAAECHLADCCITFLHAASTSTVACQADSFLRLSFVMQGTSLPKEVAEQLDDMFAHKSLTSATDTIKGHCRRLRKWQAQLDQRGQHSSHEAIQQMNDLLHRQGYGESAS